MNNKVKILRHIAINGPMSMDQLVARPITQQSRGSFKQYIYQLKNSGDLENIGGKYGLTHKSKSYLKAINEMPVDEPPDDARLDVCPDCQQVVNLEKHKCPNGDPLAEMDDAHDDSADFAPPEDDLPQAVELPPPSEQITVKKSDAAMEALDLTEDYPEEEEPEMPEPPTKAESDVALVKQSLQASYPTTPGIFVELEQLDTEIDAMKSLMIVMAHFESAGMTSGQRRRVTEWFSDRYRG